MANYPHYCRLGMAILRPQAAVSAGGHLLRQGSDNEANLQPPSGVIALPFMVLFHKKAPI